MGKYKWLSVGCENSEFELLLEPNINKVAQDYQNSLFEQSIPATMLFVDDLDFTYTKLKDKGVVFLSPPTIYGDSKIAILNDTCGNYIQLCQEQA